MSRLCTVFFVVVVVVVVCVKSMTYGEIIKCCESNHSFEKVNDTFKCSDIPSNNSHIFTSTTNFLKNNTEGQCVEFFENFYIFNISKSVILQFKIIDEKNVYSKCCPLYFLYNTHTHGCDEANNAYYVDIKENFLKVGLPKCEVIVDEIVENTTEEFYNNNTSCIDQTTNGSFILRKCLESKDACKQTRCVQKCCPDGQVLSNIRENRTCIEGYQGINLTELAIRGVLEFPEDPFVTVVTKKFSEPFFFNESNSPVYFNRKGKFSYIGNKSHRNLTSRKYCLEYVKTRDGYFFILDTYVYTFPHNYILPVSIIFLVITIIMYFLLNETKKIFAKIIVNHCLALLLWQVIMVYKHIVSKGDDVDGCLVKAYLTIFSRFAKFTWSNALCWHIWLTFGSMTGSNDVVRKRTHYKALMFYCLYGWGLPAFLTLIIFLFHTYHVLPSVIQPTVGVATCYFDKGVPGNYSRYLFMNTPVVLLQVLNVVLFVRTIIYCLKVKNQIKKMDNNADKMKQYERNKAKLYLVMKLLIIMGLTFTSSVVLSMIVVKGPVTSIVDKISYMINALQGEYIFIILICNRQIYNKIKKKLGISNADRSSSINSTTTQSSTASVRSSSININQNYTTSTL